MAQIVQKQLDAAVEIYHLVASRIGTRRVAHPEAAIVAAGRLAGTMLFRSFGIDTTGIRPGTAILSEQANQEFPVLIAIGLAVLRESGLVLDQSKPSDQVLSSREKATTMSVLQMQDLLEGEILKIKSEHDLSFREAAHSAAVAAAWFVRDCAPDIGPDVSFSLAVLGFIEGSKTVPRPISSRAKKPWYRFW